MRREPGGFGPALFVLNAAIAAKGGRKKKVCQQLWGWLGKGGAPVGMHSVLCCCRIRDSRITHVRNQRQQSAHKAPLPSRCASRDPTGSRMSVVLSEESFLAPTFAFLDAPTMLRLSSHP